MVIVFVIKWFIDTVYRYARQYFIDVERYSYSDMAQRVLYPCYFDAKLTRKEGRRVSKEKARENPTTAAILRAAKSLGLSPVEEDKAHPARWFAEEKRIVVEFSGSKETLLAQIADKL